jgi:hypothetical protein
MALLIADATGNNPKDAIVARTRGTSIGTVTCTVVRRSEISTAYKLQSEILFILPSRVLSLFIPMD